MSGIVSVTGHARLHMGFIDISASLGRRFGSIGVALEEIRTRISVEKSASLCIDGANSQRIAKIVQRFSERYQVSDAIAVTVHETIPEHVGLGSGTQLALVMGTALNELYGLDLSVPELALLSERGARSGIGIATFEQGGLVVDGGRNSMTVVPPVLARVAVPGHWCFILIFDERGQGLHGIQETGAFHELPPFPQSHAANIAHRVLMQALPALLEDDIASFGAAITDIQKSVGDYFAPAQGGRFTSPEVADALVWLAQQGAVGIGQSSWGPTGFCLTDDGERAEHLLSELSVRYPQSHLRFAVTKARNHGKIIEHIGQSFSLAEGET